MSKASISTLKTTTIQESIALYKEIQNVQNTTIKARNKLLPCITLKLHRNAI